ncbi:MAG: hypothetical protein AXA67_13500 [Methylothermaceae bacteria B42]|nr:MAG: hypothetical protein AXA67_13500 [Methylothermaceae bacteria B42]HHJ38359.1 hypothetical protein [Methylothermaceae bacterium]
MSDKAKETRTTSIFTPCTREERERNFLSYWDFSQRHAGELLESERDLSRKREKLKAFQDQPVRSRAPLPDPRIFYRNCVSWQDDPAKVDKLTLMLTCIYKFARHEWVGICGAWDATPSMAQCLSVEDKISRVHLAEEFTHIRLFHKMLLTFHLDEVEWAPPGPLMQAVYRTFPKLPGFLMDAPAFVTELMGMVFYQHLDRLFDELLKEREPEACQRLHQLLREIMVDELAHVGQRRNFIGPVGIKLSKWMIAPLFKVFFSDIPEAKFLFDIDRMIEDARRFDYSTVPAEMVNESWLPSYCIGS